jgi:hypothetical protein
MHQHSMRPCAPPPAPCAPPPAPWSAPNLCVRLAVMWRHQDADMTLFYILHGTSSTAQGSSARAVLMMIHTSCATEKHIIRSSDVAVHPAMAGRHYAPPAATLGIHFTRKHGCETHKDYDTHATRPSVPCETDMGSDTPTRDMLSHVLSQHTHVNSLVRKGTSAHTQHKPQHGISRSCRALTAGPNLELLMSLTHC